MKELVTDPAKLPDIATAAWCSSASGGHFERTMIPVKDHGECRRLYGPNFSLVYFESDHIIYFADVACLIETEWAQTKAMLAKLREAKSEECNLAGH